MLDIEGGRTRVRSPRRATAPDGTAADSGRRVAGSVGGVAETLPATGSPADPPRDVGRPVAASLSGRRLLLACALVLLLPGALAVAALSRQPPEAPPVETAAQFQVLAQVPDRVFRGQLERSQTVNRMTGKLTAPTLLDPALTGGAFQGAPATLPALALTGGAPAGTLPTLALTPRAVPYTLDELHRLVPTAFSDLAGRPRIRRRPAADGESAGARWCDPDHRRPDSGRAADQHPVRVCDDHLPRHGHHRGGCHPLGADLVMGSGTWSG